MVCPNCNVQLDHLNKGGGYAGETEYETYDYLQCPKCMQQFIEYYRTEFVHTLDKKPVFKLQ